MTSLATGRSYNPLPHSCVDMSCITIDELFEWIQRVLNPDGREPSPGTAAQYDATVGYPTEFAVIDPNGNVHRHYVDRYEAISTPPIDPPPLPQRELRWHRAQWDRQTRVHGVSSVVVVVEPLYGCNKVMSMSSSSPRPDVRGLFDFVSDAIRRKAFRIDVEYNNFPTFPSRVSVDYDEMEKGDECGFVITDFSYAQP